MAKSTEIKLGDFLKLPPSAMVMKMADWNLGAVQAKNSKPGRLSEEEVAKCTIAFSDALIAETPAKDNAEYKKLIEDNLSYIWCQIVLRLEVLGTSAKAVYDDNIDITVISLTPTDPTKTLTVTNNWLRAALTSKVKNGIPNKLRVFGRSQSKLAVSLCKQTGLEPGGASNHGVPTEFMHVGGDITVADGLNDDERCAQLKAKMNAIKMSNLSKGDSQRKVHNVLDLSSGSSMFD
uniref:Coat protein n=1 Tax=Blueberry virus A TaxID=1206566 RepID=T1YW62_9CLOS|nr:coat protein [Blueberry virus A]